MNKVRSSRQLIRGWHRNEKATIDHLVRVLGEEKNESSKAHSAFTPSGLPIEDQIRKASRPGSAGLAMF